MQHKAWLLILCTLLLLGRAHAGWIDDWIDMQASTSPGYFEGSKRNFFAFGSWSARNYTTSDYLLTLSLPRVRAGCGGIDVFMGGFGFMDFDYLTKKIQKIIANAHVFAFELGLSLVSEKVANIVDKIESTADLLNQIQLDDCKASRYLAAVVIDKVTGGALAEKRARAEADFLQSSGLDNLWQKIKETWQSNDNKPQVSEDKLYEDCPPPIKELLDISNSYSGSLLAYAADHLGLPEDWTDLIRGIIGDVKIDWYDVDGKKTLDAIYVIPCTNDDRPDIYEILFDSSKQIQARRVDGTCYIPDDENKDLKGWAYSKLTAVANKVLARKALSDDDKNFLNLVPAPVFQHILLALESNTESLILDQAANFVARGAAYRLMADLLYIAERQLLYLNEFENKSASPSPKCQIDLLADKLRGPLKTLKSVLISRIDGSQKEYQKALTAYNTAAAQANYVRRFREIVKKELYR